MHRKTSKEAYNRIVESGVLSKKRAEIYEALYFYGPMTSGECFKFLNDSKRSGILSASRSRYSELRRMGAIREKGERPCNVSGKNCIVWEVTGKMPRPLQKKKSKLQKLKEENYELKEKIKELKKKIKYLSL